MNKILINFNPMFNGRYYSEETFKKVLKDYQMRILRKERIEKLKKLNNDNK